MVEVFKTNVEDEDHAAVLIGEIRNTFHGYAGNFDLEDCDRILRIVSDDRIDAEAVIHLLHELGYKAEILPDEVPSFVVS